MNTPSVNDVFPNLRKGSLIAGVFAHPDDESLLTGGLFAMAGKEGFPCALVTVTRGELGGKFSGMYGEELAARRLKELAGAARVLHIGRVICLAVPDQGVSKFFGTVVDALVGFIEEKKPSVIITHDIFDATQHADHLATARAVIEAADRARVSLDCRIAFAPLKRYRDRKVGILDIDKYRDAKIRALSAHASQGVFRALKFPPAVYYALNHFEYIVPYEKSAPRDSQRHHPDKK